ncbi:hypothetical protein EDC04DRAFT_837757 [Pisolithus marmoratus]|nr:hypothetical protein EDC04DRAFT_837757 [Pisolithus marmoratus]
MASSRAQDRYTTRDHQRYIFVDTPGFNATYKSQKAVFENIANWLEATYRETRLQFTGAIYVRRITATESARSEQNSFQIFAKLVGNEAADRVRLVTTMWDEPEVPSRVLAMEDRENRLTEGQWAPLMRAGAVYARFDNTPESAWGIVRGLGMGKKALLLQRELVDMRKTLK